MPTSPPAHRRIFAVENLLAALVFALLLLSQIAAYLLYLYPGTAIFWQLSVPLYRITLPVLDFYDDWAQVGPLASCLGLGLFALMPLVAQIRNSWLGTACAGHIALALCVIMTMAALKRSTASRVFADVSPILDPSLLVPGSAGLAGATILLLGLCGLNHYAFFADRRQP
jgi:hypothetical protein